MFNRPCVTATAAIKTQRHVRCSQSMHHALCIQSVRCCTLHYLVIAVQRSTAGRRGRRRRGSGRRSGGRRSLLLVGERRTRSRRRRGLGWFRLSRLHHPFPDRFRRRSRRLQLGNHGVRIDGGGIALDELHRDGHRLEPVHGVGNGESGFRNLHRDRAGRLAARTDGGESVGTLRSSNRAGPARWAVPA